jgi:hypothetical protein
MSKVNFDMGGDRINIDAGGSINLKTGAMLTLDGAAQAAMTAQLTTITFTAPGTPDYAVQDLTQTSPFGFVTKDEGNSVLKAVANLQTRLAEVETRLKALGVVASS